jgi:hypothetical protein
MAVVFLVSGSTGRLSIERNFEFDRGDGVERLR